jgi:rare lipoprotein A
MPRGSLKWAGLTAAGIVLAACGSHPPTPSGQPASIEQGYYKVGRPYQIDGIWYYPREDWSYDETGIASWYGEEFHGRYTADGEIFDLNSLTAAHRTLPMPVVVRITNLENGRSMKLRVNDRGPYAAGRIIDVSRRAAQLLGFEGQGTAKVRVQIDVPDSMQVAAAAGRNGSPPSVPAIIASVASAPLTVPVAAVEAVRGNPEPPPPAAPPPAQHREVKVADMRPIAPPPPPAPLLPPPTSVPLAPPSRPAFTPVPRHEANDRPYLFDDLPGEEGAEPPTRTRDVATPASLPAMVEIRPVHPTQIYIQAGAFADHGNAARLSSRLRALGSPISVTAGITGNGASIYRVRLGPVADVDAADQLLNRVMADGFTEARIVVD